jgi:hypothetical protein
VARSQHGVNSFPLEFKFQFSVFTQTDGYSNELKMHFYKSNCYKLYILFDQKNTRIMNMPPISSKSSKLPGLGAAVVDREVAIVGSTTGPTCWQVSAWLSIDLEGGASSGCGPKVAA